MSTLEVLVADGRREPVVMRVEKMKQHPLAELEHLEQVVGEVLVLPAPSGRVTSVALRMGPRSFPYHVVHEPLRAGEKTLYQCHVNVEQGTLTLSPHPPLSEASISVEYDDGG